jgi:uncharacterized protein (DUF342 family)
MINEENKRLAEQGFTQDQIHEILEGEEVGVDVSVYAKTEFLAIQMRQIREGLLYGLDVSKYASPKYDWFQMEEIRLGLQSRVPVETYAKPSVTYDRMRQVRKGLEQGINLSRYIRFSSGILRQLRKAYLSKVNIVPYIKEGYEPKQLEEIRQALEKGIDIRPYLSPVLRGAAIQQIREGLEMGLDASVYAKTNLGWKQMQEIRLGMENRVDVSQYLHPLYSWQQMHQIRLGLENGVDVTAYKSFMYTEKEMEKRRLKLEEERLPEQGRDGWYEFLFDTGTGEPRMLPNGEPDEERLFTYCKVRKGEKVAVYHGATRGKNGHMGKEKRLLSGKGFKLAEDGKTYLAAISGRVQLKDGRLEITKLLEVDEVTSMQEDIDFDGTVYVRTNVDSGARIQATGDVIVDGCVESAAIECGGNVWIGQGVKAGTGGYIHAGQSIYGGFFEYATIRADKDIHADYYMNCDIHAEGKVFAQGSRGSIAGGCCTAVRGLTAVRLGNKASTPTRVKVGLNKDLLWQLKNTNDAIDGTEQELKILRNAYGDMIMKYPPEERNAMDVFLKVERAIFSKEKELQELMLYKAEKEKDFEETRKAEAIVSESLFDGVVLEINGEVTKCRKN